MPRIMEVIMVSSKRIKRYPPEISTSNEDILTPSPVILMIQIIIPAAAQTTVTKTAPFTLFSNASKIFLGPILVFMET